jgi:serine/threonine-protein kinase
MAAGWGRSYPWPAPEEDLLSRSFREGRYELIRPLGQGGGGEVWLARDHTLGVDRALKILRRALAEPDAHRRLRNEARAMAAHKHPHLLGIHDVGLEDGITYLVMDLAPGGTLAEAVREGKLGVVEGVDRVIEVLQALEVVHRAGVVHRDIKPQNILLDEDGRALLADFGVALVPDATRGTVTGTTLGSVAFMAPEQRQDPSRVGPAADLYGVGATLFVLLGGGSPVDLFLADERSPRFQGLPAPLVPALIRCTRLRPADRFRSAAELAMVLGAARVDLARGLWGGLGALPPPGLETQGEDASPTRAEAPPPTWAAWWRSWWPGR